MRIQIREHIYKHKISLHDIYIYTHDTFRVHITRQRDVFGDCCVVSCHRLWLTANIILNSISAYTFRIMQTPWRPTSKLLTQINIQRRYLDTHSVVVIKVSSQSLSLVQSLVNAACITHRSTIWK